MRVLPGRILCIVTDLERAGSEAALLHTLSDAVRGGVNMVQVRAHELSRESLTKLATAVVNEIGDDAVVVVNGPSNVAVESGAAGVHLRESDTLDRQVLGTGLLVGQSVHSLESARAAQEAGADYIILGTVFPSASHPGGLTGGAELVRSVTAAITVPVIGIGGITAENAAQVIEAGASGVAVIGAIIGAQDPFGAAHALASAIQLPE